jgi:hypothetical protein
MDNLAFRLWANIRVHFKYDYLHGLPRAVAAELRAYLDKKVSPIPRSILSPCVLKGLFHIQQRDPMSTPASASDVSFYGTMQVVDTTSH